MAADLSDLELALQQSVIRGRMNRQNDEMAKEQVEIAQQEALNKKIGEARKRTEGFVIRAPADGRVIAQDLDSLPGRYLQEGDQVGLLGQEDCKEVVIAVSQDDVDIFGAHEGVAEVAVRIKSGLVLRGQLAKVEPRGSTALPHPALAAIVGGPLAVKIRPQMEKTADPSGQSYEALTPVFTGKATLSATQSVQLHAGQLTTISFHTSSETVAARVVQVREDLDCKIRLRTARIVSKKAPRLRFARLSSCVPIASAGSSCPLGRFSPSSRRNRL